MVTTLQERGLLIVSGKHYHQLATNHKKYAGHSFWIKAATTAAKCDISDSLTQTLGRWQGFAYTRYIQTLPDTLKQVSTTLLTNLNTSTKSNHAVMRAVINLRQIVKIPHTDLFVLSYYTVRIISTSYLMWHHPNDYSYNI